MFFNSGKVLKGPSECETTEPWIGLDGREMRKQRYNVFHIKSHTETYEFCPGSLGDQMSPKKRDYKNMVRGQWPRWDVNGEKHFVAEFVFSSNLHKIVECTSVGEPKRKGCTLHLGLI